MTPSVDITSLLRDSQAPGGALYSEIEVDDRRRRDENGLTALVLRELRGFPSEPGGEVLNRALDFLETCEHSSGGFGFWSCTAPPPRAPHLPPDTDDTAIMALELVRSGRWKRRRLMDLYADLLVHQRVPSVDPMGPPWIHAGSFWTWIDPGSSFPNLVDCTVNANVLALMSYAGHTDLPGYAEACETIHCGLRWAGNDSARLDSLSPYYAHPGELLLALDHAVECGVDALRSAVTRLRRLLPVHSGETSRPICRNAYGETLWYMPVLEAVRRQNAGFNGGP